MNRSPSTMVLAARWCTRLTCTSRKTVSVGEEGSSQAAMWVGPVVALGLGYSSTC